MKKLTFIQMSDLHYRNNDHYIENIQNSICEDINNYVNKHYKVDFILFSGDFVNGSNLSKKHKDDTSIFTNAYKEFFEPITKALSLNANNIFFTPGNHDLNRSLVAKTAESTYSFNSLNNINDIISDIENELTPFLHFNQFNTFIKDQKNTHLEKQTKLFTTYKIVLDSKINLGIVCFNSCINAFSSKSIHGNVIIGEKHLQDAIKSLNDCDIKILNMHYPIQWVNQYEYQKLLNLITKNFNLFFVGHEHFKTSSLSNINQNENFTYNSPSLYQGDGKLCGYTIFEYDFSKMELKIQFREYDHTNYLFKSSNEIDNITINDYDIFNHLGKEKHNIIVNETLKDNFIHYINTTSLSSKSNNELIFDNMYIYPELSTQSAYKDDNEEDDTNTFEINDILNDDKNYIFYGSELIGKTSLLFFIAREFMMSKTESIKIPIYINLNEIQKINKSAVIQEIKLFLDNYTLVNNSNKAIQEKLNNNSFVLLLDNLPTNQERKMQILQLLCKDFNSQKVFITSIEDTYKSITFEDKENANDNCQINECFTSIFINSYKREKVREFFKKWFKDSFDEFMFEKFYDYINKFNIPATPFIFSLLALSYEKGIYEEYPNEIILLEAFLDNLLGKGESSKLKSDELSYKLKKKYLSTLAKNIMLNQTKVIDKFDLENLTSSFLQDHRMYELNTQNIITYFEKKDILVKSFDNKIYKFKFKTFQEYFTAYEMKNNNEFKNTILTHYIQYMDEIKFYAGITESEDDYLMLIDKFFNIIKDGFEDYKRIEENTGSFLYEDIESLTLEKSNELFKPLPHEEKDKKLEVNNKQVLESNIKHSIDENKISDEEKYFKSNLLSMSILKYAETVENSDLIHDFLLLVLESHSKLFYSIVNRIENIDQEDLIKKLNKSLENKDINKEKFTSEKLMLILKSLYNVMTSIFSTILSHTLFDEHLINLLNKNIDKCDTLVKLFIVIYYVHEDNKKMFDYIDLLTKDLKSNPPKYKGYFFSFLYFAITRLKLDLIRKSHKDKLIDKLIEMISSLFPTEDKQQKNIINTKIKQKLLINIAT